VDKSSGDMESPFQAKRLGGGGGCGRHRTAKRRRSDTLNRAVNGESGCQILSRVGKWARSLPLDRTSLPQIRTEGQHFLFIFVFYYIPYSNTMIIGRKKSLTPWRINFQKERFCGEKKSPNHTISGKNLLYELFTFKVFTPWPASKTQEGPKVTWLLVHSRWSVNNQWEQITWPATANRMRILENDFSFVYRMAVKN
jgi:hypothetical protein